MHNRGTRPKSYDRGEPSGGLAGAAPRVIKGGWAQEFAWSRKHVPETADPERQLHNRAIAFELSAAAAPDLCLALATLRAAVITPAVLNTLLPAIWDGRCTITLI